VPVWLVSPLRKSRLRKLQGSNKPNKNANAATGANGTPVVFALLVVILSSVLVVLGLILLVLWPNDNTEHWNHLPHIRGTSLLHPASLGIFPPAYPKLTRETAGSAATGGTKLSPEALDMCTNTLWHTLETTTIVLPDGETFIHTGDIDDLWLRDSAAQVHPLLVSSQPNNKQNGKQNSNQIQNGTLTALIAQDPKLDRIVSGLIKRTAMYIRHDPYANAFRIDDSYKFSEAQKKMGRHDLISTWNYELDSGCYYMRLLYFYWKQSPNSEKTDSVLRLPAVQEAVTIMVDLWMAEQKHELDAFPVGPLFDCINCNQPYRYPGLDRKGKGTPTNSSSGLTWTGFRPSDDECKYGFLVPANMFAVTVLEYMVDMASDIWGNPHLAQRAQKLATDIQRGIQEYAIVDHPDGKSGKIYAYEVDGLGNYELLDDANVPSLLSIPYLGYTHYDPEIYANTRRFILSPANPTYRKGTNEVTGDIEGYGSPHMSQAIRDNIWPMALAVQGLISDDREEKIRIIESLVKAAAGTGWMHESFSVSNPKKFTRSWFCWADSLFGECNVMEQLLDCSLHNISASLRLILTLAHFDIFILYTAELVLSVTDECPNPKHKYEVMEWRDHNVILGGQFAID
jgi:meiotically up-regulated gene 157 (Mug157) protein